MAFFRRLVLSLFATSVVYTIMLACSWTLRCWTKPRLRKLEKSYRTVLAVFAHEQRQLSELKQRLWHTTLAEGAALGADVHWLVTGKEAQKARPESKSILGRNWRCC